MVAGHTVVMIVIPAVYGLRIVAGHTVVMIVIPAVYGLVKGWGLQRLANQYPRRSVGRRSERTSTMMDYMMGGGMMWGMRLIGLLLIIVLVLGAAALVKYLFLSKGQ